MKLGDFLLKERIATGPRFLGLLVFMIVSVVVAQEADEAEKLKGCPKGLGS